jgi:O-antigen ligase
MDSPTDNAVGSRASMVANAVAAELSSLRLGARVAAASVAAGIVVLTLAAGAAAGGLALLAVVALGIALRRPYLLGPFVALCLPAGDAVHVLGAQVAPLEAVVGGGAIGYLARVAARREGFRLRTVDWVFALLLAFIALSTLGPVDDSDRLRELLLWCALGIVFHAIGEHVHSRRDRRLLLGGVAVAALVESLWALFEYVDRWSERFSVLNGAIVYPLPQGTLGHPNALSQFLVLVGLAALALGLSEDGLLRRFGLLVAGASALALVVTFSRASWIAFAAGILVYLIDRRARLPVLVAGTVAATGAALLALLDAGAIGARISSLFRAEAGGLYDFRLEIIRRGTRVAADHPLTGAGHFEEVGVYAGRPDIATHPHNLFLGVAVFFGIPAALAFGGLVVLALRASWRGLRSRSDETRMLSLGFLAVLVALLVNGLLEYPLWNTSLAVLVVVVLAVAVSLDRAPSTSPARE